MISRITRSIRRRARIGLSRMRGVDPVTGLPISSPPELVTLGSTGGSWTIPSKELTPTSIVYCAGCGENISFDLEVIKRFRCDVYAFDPTPRASAYAQARAKDNPKYNFFELGLWDQDDTLMFFEPKNNRNVSHSILNLQRTTDGFEARVRRLSHIAQELGHARIDLLKLDIEGAEYRVLSSLIEDRLLPKVLCVEFDEHFMPQDANYKSRIECSLRLLLNQGYSLIHTTGMANYTLLHHI